MEIIPLKNLTEHSSTDTFHFLETISHILVKGQGHSLSKGNQLTNMVVKYFPTYMWPTLEQFTKMHLVHGLWLFYEELCQCYTFHRDMTYHCRVKVVYNFPLIHNYWKELRQVWSISRYSEVISWCDSLYYTMRSTSFDRAIYNISDGEIFLYVTSPYK